MQKTSISPSRIVGVHEVDSCRSMRPVLSLIYS
jgi:hypothetical protein